MVIVNSIYDLHENLPVLIAHLFGGVIIRIGSSDLNSGLTR